MSERKDTVFNESINDKNKHILLEQYKLYIESANTTSSLRNQANMYFLTINTVLISFLAAILEFSNYSSISYWIVFACLAGILLAISWFFLIRSYRSLNSGRFAVIHELEQKLPARIYNREWELITSKRPEKSRYIRQTYVEQAVPVAFGILYVALALSYLIVGLP